MKSPALRLTRLRRESSAKQRESRWFDAPHSARATLRPHFPATRCNRPKAPTSMEAPAIVQLPCGRFIHVALAIQLLPALLAVFVVGAAGVVIVAFCGLFARAIGREACLPREVVATG